MATSTDMLAQQAALGRTGFTQASLQAPGIIQRGGEQAVQSILQAASMVARLRAQQEQAKQQQAMQFAQALQSAMMQQAEFGQRTKEEQMRGETERDVAKIRKGDVNELSPAEANMIGAVEDAVAEIDSTILKLQLQDPEGKDKTVQSQIKLLQNQRTSRIDMALGTSSSSAAQKYLKQRYGVSGISQPQQPQPTIEPSPTEFNAQNTLRAVGQGAKQLGSSLIPWGALRSMQDTFIPMSTESLGSQLNSSASQPASRPIVPDIPWTPTTQPAQVPRREELNWWERYFVPPTLPPGL